MARIPKMARLALVASLLGGTAIVPVVLSGSASAQAGARICGRVWFKNQIPGDEGSGYAEIIYKLYEVNAAFDNFVCDAAKNGGSSAKDPTEGPKLLTENIMRDGTDWEERAFGDLLTCEWVTTESLPNLVLKEGGGSWPDASNNTNICHNMNRSENLGEMRAYWSLWSSTTGLTSWFMHG